MLALRLKLCCAHADRELAIIFGIQTYVSSVACLHLQEFYNVLFALWNQKCAMTWSHVIHLHHPDNDGHLGNVWTLVKALSPIEEIDAEIARCEPLCNSCHKKHHNNKESAARRAKLGEG